MDEITEYALKLSERARARVVNPEMFKVKRPSLDDGKQRSDGPDCGDSPPKRQCLIRDKENSGVQLAPKLQGLAALRRGTAGLNHWGTSCPIPREGAASLASRDNAGEAAQGLRPRGLAALRHKCAHVEAGTSEEPCREGSWDPRVLASLEAQGFTRSPSASTLTYAFGRPKPASEPGPLGLGCPPRGARDSPNSAQSGTLKESHTNEKSCSQLVAGLRCPSGTLERKSVPQSSSLGGAGEDPPVFPLRCPRPSTPVQPELLSVAQRRALFEGHARLAAATQAGARGTSDGRDSQACGDSLEKCLPEVSSEESPQVLVEETPEFSSKELPEVSPQVVIGETPEFSSKGLPEVSPQVVIEETPEFSSKVSPQVVIEETPPEDSPEVSLEESSENSPDVSPEVWLETLPDVGRVPRLYPVLPPVDLHERPVGLEHATRSLATPSGGSTELALVHTQSVYRRKLVSAPARPAAPVEETPPRDQTLARILALGEEAAVQEGVMRQASRALALCRAMPEFSGSAEQVEGERLLLLAAERQQACLAEAERLKTQGGCAGQGQSPAGRASLTLSCLELPLRKDFLAAQLQGALGGDVHHFVCLVKQGPHVLASQMLSTAGGQSTLRFTNHMTLLDLAPDFLVTVHVCALQTKKETLPHDRKYRIGTKAKLKLTPRVDKTSGKTGGQAVDCGPLRPSFGLVGVVHLTLANWRRSTFHLDKVPAHSPLEGTLLAQLKLRPQQHPQVRGFLTMFEDVGGLGAWHRRWCLLAKNRLSFWRYPEDEGTKEPKGWLDLHESSDMDSRLVSRDVCARPHTLALAVAGVQRLLSADTREEAKRWCAGLNAALHWTRTWAC